MQPAWIPQSLDELFIIMETVESLLQVYLLEKPNTRIQEKEILCELAWDIISPMTITIFYYVRVLLLLHFKIISFKKYIFPFFLAS